LRTHFQILFRLGLLVFTILLASSPACSQSWSEAAAELGAERGEFIAALDWSVERSRNFVWPFESLPPAPFASVLLVVDSMPRVLPEKRGNKPSVVLSAQCCLQVNGRSLTKSQRARESQSEYRISLERGRLWFSFSLPSGVKLDPRYTLIRIKLYQINKQHNRDFGHWTFASVRMRTLKLRDVGR